MSERTSSLLWKATLALLGLVLWAPNASAYAGPVPGPEFFGYFMSLAAWMGVAFSSLLLWPLHALRQRFRKSGATVPAAAAEEPKEEACAQP